MDVAEYTRDLNYPSVPRPEHCYPVADAPDKAGIYFAWTKGDLSIMRVDYVGRSTSLQRRLSGGHHALRRGDGISFLTFPERETKFAECYYIALCRPPRNFGGRVSRGSAVASPFDPESESILTIRKAAERVGCHPETISPWVRRNGLHAINIGTPKKPSYRIYREDLDRFFSSLLASHKRSIHSSSSQVDTSISA